MNFLVSLPLLLSAAPYAAGEDIQDELERLGERLGAAGAAEDIAIRAQVREVLSGLVKDASTGGPGEEKALEVIARVCVSPKRTLAMEGSLALLSIPGPAGLRTFLGVLRRMDPAVARQTLDMVIAQGIGVSGLEKEVLGLLATEGRPELASRLVELAASLGTVEAARAVLRAAPPSRAVGPEGSGSRASAGGALEPRTSLEEAVEAAIDRLAAEAAPAATRDWLADGAFREAAGRPGAAAALVRAVARGTLRVPRALLLGLLGEKEEAVRIEVLGALDRLELFALSDETSRAVLDLLGADETFRSRAVVRRAAWLLARGSPDRAAALLAGRAGDPSWEVRRAAAEGLGELSPQGAAFQAVLSLLDDPNREVRRSAFESLGRFPMKEAVDRAIGILGSARGPRREEALSWLEWASGGRRGAEPREWERWWASAREGFEMPAAVRREAGRDAERGAALWKLTPLLTGLCRLGEDHVLGGSRSPEKRLAFAIYSFLAEGSGGEVVLIDLGPKTLEHTNAMFRRYGFFRESDGTRLHPDDIVEERGNALTQLKARGIGLERVRHIIFTHLHADHHGLDDGKDGGAAADFPLAVFHVSKRGWEENLERRRAAGRWASYVDFAFSDFLLSMRERGRCLFEDDVEVVPGIRTRFLGGHSPCSQAVVVDTASGPAVIASDEVYHYALLEGGVLARINTSPGNLVAATDLLAELALDRGAILLPAHEPRLEEAFEKAGEGWLLALRGASDRAARGYREHRRLGTLRLAGAPEGKE